MSYSAQVLPSAGEINSIQNSNLLFFCASLNNFYVKYLQAKGRMKVTRDDLVGFIYPPMKEERWSASNGENQVS